MGRDEVGTFGADDVMKRGGAWRKRRWGAPASSTRRHSGQTPNSASSSTPASDVSALTATSLRTTSSASSVAILGSRRTSHEASRVDGMNRASLAAAADARASSMPSEAAAARKDRERRGATARERSPDDEAPTPESARIRVRRAMEKMAHFLQQWTPR